MADSSTGVLLQNLRAFTVQIRRPSDGTTCGTGVVVSTDGLVATCAHVAEQAAGRDPRSPDGAEVEIHFPRSMGRSEPSCRATVVASFVEHGDDVVLLRPVGEFQPLKPDQVAVLGSADASMGHEFQSYGFRRLDKYTAGRAIGLILGSVEPPEGARVQADPVQLRSGEINHGMSGAAVLDTKRNLVVGLVSETWFPDLSSKDRDTAWAVDGEVLSLEPLRLPLRDAPLPLRSAPQPRREFADARQQVSPTEAVAWNNAPAPLDEWVGRDELRQSITEAWLDPEIRAMGLIGFGGEGKSSLARRWIDDLLAGPAENRPDGLFWWGFYDRPSSDGLLEAALAYLGGGKIDAAKLGSASVRAQVIGSMLAAGRFLFVLDGTEVMQHQSGDAYSLFRSNELRELVGYFAAPGHASFCLLTSRVPILDLLDFTTYRHEDISRLSPADGRQLLEKVGVRGGQEALDRVVEDWDGHALTLSLLGTYLAEHHQGDVSRIDAVPTPTADEPRYDRVSNILRRYDEHLTPAAKEFLTIFCAFRRPVGRDAFSDVFWPPDGGGPLHAALSTMNEEQAQAMLQQLVDSRLLRFNAQEAVFTAHPLVRAHYAERLAAAGAEERRELHVLILGHYMESSGGVPQQPTLDLLTPFFEAVHHACRAGKTSEALAIHMNAIHQGTRRALENELGAYNVSLELLAEFFPDGDTERDPELDDPARRAFVIGDYGFALKALGRLQEAFRFLQRSQAINVELGDHGSASVDLQNMTAVLILMGSLREAESAGRESLAVGEKKLQAIDDEELRIEYGRRILAASLSFLARAQSLQGNTDDADKAFARALEFQVEEPMLYSFRGIHQSEHLRRCGEVETARRISQANLEIARAQRWPDDQSLCHSVLGRLEADAGQETAALEQFDSAVRVARGISKLEILLDALTSRGRFLARQGDADGALADLDEALAHAQAGGFRLFEIDIGVGLAWAQLARGEQFAARAEAERSLVASRAIGYHWGRLDAEELLERLTPA